MVKEKKKKIINFVFILLVFSLTFYAVFKGQDINEILKCLKQAKKLPLIAGIILLIIFVCSESVIIWYLSKKVNHKVKLRKCIKYSFVGFFYSSVTPSSSGGQPMQVLYMKKDGINVAVSTLIIIIVTILYKAVLILFGVLAGTAEYDIIKNSAREIWFLLAIGVTANILFIAFLLVVVFKQSFAKRTISAFIIKLGKKGIIKNYDKYTKKALEVLKKYENCADYIKGNKKALLVAFAITFVQRVCMFLITYMVYCSFGLHTSNAFEIVALQTVLSLAVDCMPVPGAIGFSESCFILLFDGVFGTDLIIPAMLLSRGITYYALLIISAAVTFLAHIFQNKRMDTNQ